MTRTRFAYLPAVLAAVLTVVTTAALAMYDAPPSSPVANLEGVWQGTLQYRDYQPPHKRVTLLVRLFVAASSPNEVALHYVFADGPGKTVHSYDRLALDLDGNMVRFIGSKPSDVNAATIVSRKNVDDGVELMAERTEESRGETQVIRYRIRLDKGVFEVLKTAGPKGAEGEFRNEYVFRR